MENNESKIKKVLFNEVSLAISIMAFAIGCILFISEPDAKMRQDISLIEQKIETIESNHLITIQKELEKQGEQIDFINIKLERILTLLGE